MGGRTSEGTVGNTFSMTYGTEAVIPSKIGLSSMRISVFAPEENNDKPAEDLDLLEE